MMIDLPEFRCFSHSQAEPPCASEHSSFFSSVVILKSAEEIAV